MEHKIGVIGVGVWGCHSLERELLATGRAGIAMIYAGNELGANCYGGMLPLEVDNYAASVGAEVADSWEKIVADPAIDIVSVMTSPKFKSKIICSALQHGKAVVTDKPLGLTVDDVLQIEKTAGFNPDRIFMLAGYWNRPGVAKVIDTVNAGKLGRIKAVSIRLNFMGGIYPGFVPSVQWRQEVPSGEMTTIGSHAIVTLLKIVQTPPVKIYALPRNYFYPSYAEAGAEDWADMNISFAGGAVANLSVGRTPYRIPGEDIFLEVTGTGGYAILHGNRLELYCQEEALKQEMPGFTLKDTFNACLDSFEQHTAPAVNYLQGLVLQQILSAGIASAYQGQPVTINT